MIKQLSEYKLQVKALREQEMDMRDQVQSTGIMGNISSFFFQLSAGMYNVFLCFSAA